MAQDDVAILVQERNGDRLTFGVAEGGLFHGIGLELSAFGQISLLVHHLLVHANLNGGHLFGKATAEEHEVSGGIVPHQLTASQFCLSELDERVVAIGQDGVDLGGNAEGVEVALDLFTAGLLPLPTLRLVGQHDHGQHAGEHGQGSGTPNCGRSGGFVMDFGLSVEGELQVMLW